MQRNPSIDILRGVLLLLMTMTHLPTVWSAAFGEPLGFISAAEGFVFLSAFMAGKVFTTYRERDGVRAANRWILGRTMRIYLAHLLLLVLAFTVVAWIATTYHRPAVRNLLDFYFQSPRRAFVSGAMLVYQPPLLDILPMYVLFSAATPTLMQLAERYGWKWVLSCSMAVWTAAQFGLRSLIHTFVQTACGWDVPISAMGSFDLYAWQLLWVLGLWFGALGYGKTREVLASGGSILGLALVISCAMFAWRHYSGPMGFTDLAKHLFWIDKWTLSPVRVVNFAAALCILLGFGSRLAKRIRLPSIEAVGRASLVVFAVHIATALLFLCLIDVDDQPLRGYKGILVIVAGYAALFTTASIYRNIQRARSTAAVQCPT
jgi:hypothetical protein